MDDKKSALRYESIASVFNVDGSLRDIFASGTAISDWNQLLNLAHRSQKLEYFVDGVETSLPLTAASIFEDNKHTHFLRINLGGPTLNTHFFVVDEIELDLDPKEVNSQADLDMILKFCAALGHEISRDVFVTPENTPEIFYFSYSAELDAWRLRESG